MEVKDAKETKRNLEQQLLNLFMSFENTTGLEIAAVMIERRDASSMGDQQTILVGVEVIAGIDVPPSVAGGGE